MDEVTSLKSQRQSKILELIAAEDIETQEQLQAALKKEGISTTQATISRDIKELRIVKELTSKGIYRYTVSSADNENVFSSRLNTIFRECVIGCDYAQNIMIIRTMPGLANAAAAAIDSMGHTYIVGSLAGDDTVMVVLRDNHSATVFNAEIKNLMK